MTNDSSTITRNIYKDLMTGALVCNLVLTMPWFYDPDIYFQQACDIKKESLASYDGIFQDKTASYGVSLDYLDYEIDDIEMGRIIKDFTFNFVANMESLEPEIMEKVEENFWDLI